MSTGSFFSNLLSLLRVRPVAGGVEVSDSALRFASSDGSQWRFASVRLPQGVLEDGVIKDRGQFVEALLELKRQAEGEVGGKEIRTIAVLSSANVYSQVFRIPVVNGENLEHAVALNLEMASPIDRAKAYAGWQVVGRDEKSVNVEVLSAFVDRAQMDEIVAAFEEAGFGIYAVESRAIALTRLLRGEGVGFEADVPSLMLTIDGSGMEFLIVRGGQLYFRYFVAWRDVQGDLKEISWEVFQAAFTRHLRQVVNYYGSHWKGDLRDVFCVAGNLKDGVSQAIQQNFPALQVKTLALRGGDIAEPEWFIPMGGALRGLVSPHDDRELNLLAMSARKEFQRRETVAFIKFWRIVVPVALALFLAAAFGADVYLVRLRAAAEANAHAGIGASARKEIAALEAKANEFNALVASVRSAGGDTFRKADALEMVDAIFAADGALLTKFSISEKRNVIAVAGRADSEEKVGKLVAAFKSSDAFQDVNLPLTDLSTKDDGVYFSMTFSRISPNTP